MKTEIILGIVAVLILTGCSSLITKPATNTTEINMSSINIINSTPPPPPLIISAYKDNNTNIFIKNSVVIYEDKTIYLIDAEDTLPVTLDNMTVKYLILSNYLHIDKVSMYILKYHPQIFDNGISTTSKIYEIYHKLSDVEVVYTDYDASPFLLLPAYDYGFNQKENDNTIMVKYTYLNFSMYFMGECGNICERKLTDKVNVIVLYDGECRLSLDTLLNIMPDAVVYTGTQICDETDENLNLLSIPIYYGETQIYTDGNKFTVINGGKEYE